MGGDVTVGDTEKRSEATREHILDAAARLFARRSFTAVGVTDVIADAGVTKGGLYFHFSSKEALALAIIEHHAAAVRANTMELLTRQLSGLETLIDITFMVARLDAFDVHARAAAKLEDALGRTSGGPVGLLDEWIKGSILVLEQAIADGDVRSDCDPEDVATMLVSHYVGVRRVSDLDAPESFFTGIRNSWCTSLRGIANPHRLDYLTEFVERRTAAITRGSSDEPRH